MLILSSSSRSGTRFHYDVLLDETKLIPDPAAMIPDPDFVPDPDNPDVPPPMIPDPNAPLVPDPAFMYIADWIADAQGANESDEDFAARLDAYQVSIERDLAVNANAALMHMTQSGSVPLADEGGRELVAPTSGQ
jgi:hypothetical protein